MKYSKNYWLKKWREKNNEKTIFFIQLINANFLQLGIQLIFLIYLRGFDIINIHLPKLHFA